MTQPVAYMTTVEVDTAIALELVSTDPRLLSWSSSTDQSPIARQATADLDAVTWRGKRVDIAQGLAWPRHESIEGQLIDPDPDQGASPSVADLPRDLKRAFAIQCGFRAMRAVGVDSTAGLDRAAHKGVVSQGGGGQSISMDLRRASDPWSRLDPDAASLVRRYRSTGAPLA